jgi:hypothetical protein
MKKIKIGSFSEVTLLVRFISFVPNMVFTWYIGVKQLSQSCSFHYNEKMNDLKKKLEKV